MSELRKLYNKDSAELTEVEKCLLCIYDPQRYDPDYVNTDKAAAELASRESAIADMTAENTRLVGELEQLRAAIQDDQKDNEKWRNETDVDYTKGYYTGRRDEAMSVLNFLTRTEPK